jgi:CrcB protein
VITASLVDRHHLPAWIRVGLVMGVIGGYTTFSTFAQEALTLFDAHDAAVALVYTIGSVVTGIAAVFVGEQLGRVL